MYLTFFLITFLLSLLFHVGFVDIQYVFCYLQLVAVS